MNREQMIEVLVADEMNDGFVTEADVEELTQEYERELERLNLNRAKNIEMVGDADGDVVYRIGRKLFGIDGQGLMRYMYPITKREVNFF